jgi:hypothetical protein
METKVCIRCGKLKPLSEYYKHKKMGDGHLNKCKSCCKEQAKKRHDDLSQNPEWVLSERKRSREKYHRLGYKENQKEVEKLYPWKSTQEYKSLRRNFQIKNNIKLSEDIELHHWSYKKEHMEDVFLIKRSNHKKLHAKIKVDVEKRCYVRKDNGEVLDTKEKHKAFAKEFGFIL